MVNAINWDKYYKILDPDEILKNKLIYWHMAKREKCVHS